MRDLVTGRVAMVTGGARGIGLAVVEAIVARGVGVRCVDLDGVMFACQAEHEVLRGSGGSGGSIVNIASMSGHIVNRGVAHTAYSAAKAPPRRAGVLRHRHRPARRRRLHRLVTAPASGSVSRTRRVLPRSTRRDRSTSCAVTRAPAHSDSRAVSRRDR